MCNINDTMTIKRFSEFPKKNEDIILDECGCPEALYSKNDLRFYIASEKLGFLFLEEQDIVWIKKPDAFSMEIDGSMRKTALVPEIEKKLFAVFIKEIGKAHYTFYGVYKLCDPYTLVSGAGKVLNGHTPLVFNLECGDYVV